MAYIVRDTAKDETNPPTSKPPEYESQLPPQEYLKRKREQRQQQRQAQKQHQNISSWTSPRSLKQVSLFFAGATFLTASTFLTRRHINKRRLAQIPARFTPSNQQPLNRSSGPLDAFEALSLATLNVTAFAIMMVGGLRWAFDVSTMDDLKRLVRGGMGFDGTGRSEREAEEDFEEWMAGVLERSIRKEEERKRREGDTVVSARKWINERRKER